MIVDLRLNGGGSRIINPLLAQLGHYKLDQRGKLFVLTDRNTYSSGFHGLLTMRKLKAIYVGEPSSQKLNYGGDIFFQVESQMRQDHEFDPSIL